MVDLNDPVLQKISVVVPGEFREALADAGTGVWLWDIAADQIDFSAGMVALTGMSELNGGRRDEVLAGLIHPEDISKIQDSTRRLFDGAKSYETLCRMQHNSGHYIWAYTHGTLVRG
ncbi:MAG: PAS domain-containing protein, partial [Sneathiella sp.]